MTTTTFDPSRLEAFAGRVLDAATDSLELLTMYLGHRLGLYRALRETGPLTAAELAAATGTAERHVREWLEAQAACDIVDADGDRYSLAPEHAVALLDRDSLAHVVPFVRMLPAFVNVMRPLLEAFRTGGGVPYERYGAEFREAQQDLTRPLYMNLLAEWIAALPHVHSRLLADRPARALDMACGAGIACVELARRYPWAQVDGIDLDEGAIDLARANAREAGVEGRVRFHVRDAERPGLAGPYDLITSFDSLHHVARPVEVLRQLRSLLAPGGVVLVAEGHAHGPFERLNRLVSVVHCLPTALVDQPSAGLGAVVPAATVAELAAAAGFERVEVAPIEHDLLAFYTLEAGASVQ